MFSYFPVPGLFHRHGLGQIARLVHVAALVYGDIVRGTETTTGIRQSVITGTSIV